MDNLHSSFDAELAYGQAYQQAYQDYEAAKIAVGTPLTAPDFFDEFHAGRDPIASPQGPEEWFARVPQSKMHEHVFQRTLAWALVGAGLAALAAALLLRMCARPGNGNFAIANADLPPYDRAAGANAELPPYNRAAGSP